MKLEIHFKVCVLTTKRIHEIAILNRKTISSKNIPKSIYYLDTGNITKNKINELKFLKLDIEKYPSRAQRIVQDKTIIYSTVRPNQEHYGFLENPLINLIVSTGFTTLDVIDKNIEPKYLYYLLTQKEITNYLHMIGQNSVSSYPSINPSDLGFLKFKFPEKSIQQKIANILSSLDSKIELNNKINKELDAMEKTLYNYWFVQFDFPNENGKPYKSSGGKMIYSKEFKKDIPEGWVVKKLGDYAEIKRGDLITARETLEGKIKVVAAGINYSYLHSKSNREENTITISGSGANAGHINFWREPIFASDCTTVRGKNDIDTIMILNHLYLLQDYIYSQSKGSAQPHVYPEDIKQLFIPVAPDYLVNKFCAIVLPLNKRIVINEQQNQELAKLRDWLLPMLMNGQVRVK